MRPVLYSFVFILFAALCPWARANDLGNQKHYLTIPILYITDRAASPKGFAGQRKVEDFDSIYNLNCGTLQYTLKNPVSEPLNKLQTELGWSQSKKRQSRITTHVLPCSGKTDAYKDFGQAVIEAAKNAGTSEIFVIVHGFNTTHEGAANSAAQLAYNVQRPVILYDWPSKGRPGQYAVDAGNNEWSQEHFDQFLEELQEIKISSGLKINLLAHSMGNRLVIRSAPVLRGKHLFDQMFLVDPDFDSETFVHYLARYGNKVGTLAKSDAVTETANPTRVRIFFSHKDNALPLAELLFGGYTRLGQAADSMLSSVFALNPLSILAEHANANADSPPTVAAAKPSWLLQFEWIDFTVLDHGLIGHTIPYSLIAHLWTDNQPGDGLKLVIADTGRVNGLSRLSLGLFHERKRVSSQMGTCERVVFTNKGHQALVEGSVTAPQH
jgi:esterase/lipase superfamily enzyme